jgi:hypothetical protein
MMRAAAQRLTDPWQASGASWIVKQVVQLNRQLIYEFRNCNHRKENTILTRPDFVIPIELTLDGRLRTA